MRILCIDDEPLIRELLTRHLGRDNEVVCLADACEAMDRLVAGAEYDVIVCDVLMPDCTGIHIYRALEKTRPELCRRMIFLTGGRMIPAIDTFAKETGCAMLEKPFTLDELEESIRKVTEP